MRRHAPPRGVLVTTALQLHKTRPGGIRAAVSLLLLIPILVPLFAAALIWLSERDEARASEDRVAAAARIVGANVRNLVESTLDRLRRVDEALGPDPVAFEPKPSGPGEGITLIYDAAGATIMRNGQRGANVATNAAFIALRDGDPWTITPLLGEAGALRFFGIARRLERDGQFAGLVSALLPADTLSEVWAEVALGVESTVSVVRDDGWVVTRYPVPAEGINLSSYDLFTVHLPNAPDGVYISPASPVDSIPRTVGYQSLKDLGLIVIASRSHADTTEAFWTRVGSTALVVRRDERRDDGAHLRRRRHLDDHGPTERALEGRHHVGARDAHGGGRGGALRRQGAAEALDQGVGAALRGRHGHVEEHVTADPCDEVDGGDGSVVDGQRERVTRADP